MLYERWRKIAGEYGHELALCEPASGRRWSFAQLADDAELVKTAADSISYPQGITAGFVLTVLRAWRAGQVVLPLETGQQPFAISGLPPEIVHLKTTSA